MDGNLLRFGETREIAIYRRDGVAWVADFRGIRGELFTAGEWFALNNRGNLARRAQPVPLSAEAIERIEGLHRVEERSPLAAAGAWLRDLLAGFFRELSCRAPSGCSPRVRNVAESTREDQPCSHAPSSLCTASQVT